jgi:hypothetical protein
VRQMTQNASASKEPRKVKESGVHEGDLFEDL